mmetsp:Transcript_9302/g.16316  ORF Transcript_9302/g.16316 Transcript_9302/m.16316 type:complete len:216 (+) Transcript_9302:645-1292(+)
MEVSFRGSTFTEEGCYYAALWAFRLHGVRCSCSLRELSGERAANGMIVEFLGPVVHRHLASLSWVILVGKALVCKVVQRIAAPQKHTGFAVLSENIVFRLKPSCTSDVNCFFAPCLHVKRDASLTLCLVEYAVHDLEFHHSLVHVEAHFLANVGFAGALDELAFLVQDLERITSSVLLWKLEVHFAGELVVQCIGAARLVKLGHGGERSTPPHDC